MINKNQKTWKSVLLVFCVFIFLGGCDRNAALQVESKQSVGHPGAAASADWVSMAREAINRNKLTGLADSCVKLEVDDQAVGEPVEITATEMHNASCGGDPATEPRLFTLHIDRKTHEISSDTLSEDGGFLPLK